MPTSQCIFLVGGEEPEYYPRKEIYKFDLVSWEQDRSRPKHPLEMYARMPAKKFDCILAHMGGWLYILGGKGTGGEILATCHRFHPGKREFQDMASLKFPRYAGSAASVGSRLFVFGGRKAEGNQVVSQIEVWDAQVNLWTEVVL
jgi:N-acetylneuraminic acid mutarotase